MTSIHAHNVLRELIQAGAVGSKADIRQLIRDKFGSQTRFYACSAAGMGAEELIEFLLARDKIALVDGKYIVNVGNICDADES